MHPDEIATQVSAQRVVLHTMSARDQGVSVAELGDAVCRPSANCYELLRAAVADGKVVAASIAGINRFYATQAQADAHAARIREQTARLAKPRATPAQAHTPFAVAGPRVFSGSMGRGYEPSNTPGFAPRPGQDDFKQWPSRRGNLRYYRDGRVEAV